MTFALITGTVKQAPAKWSPEQDFNLRPLAPKASALNKLSYPEINFLILSKNSGIFDLSN